MQRRKKISRNATMMNESVAAIECFLQRGSGDRTWGMDFATLLEFGPDLLIGLVALAILAGVVKGMVGFAMPMILVSGLATFLPPEPAIAGMILPTLITNGWQAFRQGLRAAAESIRAHWRYLLIMLLCIAISSQFVTVVRDDVLFLLIGIPVSVFAAIQLIGWRPIIDPAKRGRVEVGAATTSGLIGGLCGVWGPPTVLYLTALDTPKPEQMRVQGVFYGIGAVMLTLAHLRSGVFDAEGAALSAFLLMPALLGLWVGFRFQDRIDQALFRRLTLAVLIIAGLNLVRRGLMG